MSDAVTKKVQRSALQIVRHLPRILVGGILGGALFWLLFHDTNMQVLRDTLDDIQITWVVGAEACIFLVVLVRVVRWRYILSTFACVPWMRLFCAEQIGDFLNALVPARIGEGVRAIVLNRTSGVALSHCFATVFIERLCDFFAAIAIIATTFLFIRPSEPLHIPQALVGWQLTIPPDFFYWGGTLATLIFILGFIFVWVFYLWGNICLSILEWALGKVKGRWTIRVKCFFIHFLESVRTLTSFAIVLQCFFLSALSILLVGVAGVCLLNAFCIPAPWWGIFVIPAIIAIAVFLPAAPVMVGQFHLGAAVAVLLLAPHSEIPAVKAYTLLFHALEFLTIIVLGITCMLWDGKHILCGSRVACKN